MKKSLCKLISIVLALAMTVGLLPVSALAAPDVDAVDGETASTADFYVDATVVESGDGSADAPFATLDEALKAAAKVDGAVIHVVGELTVSGAVDIAAYYNNEANSDYDVSIVGDALHFDEGAMITVSAPDVPEVEAEGDTADEPEADTETEEVTGDTVPEVAGDTEEVTEGEPETRPEAENEDAPETQSEEKSEDAPAEVTADEVNDTPAEPTADEVEDELTDEPAGNTEDVDEPEDVDAPADGNDTADEPANTSDDEPADGSDITTPAPVAYTGTATLKDILVTGSLAVDGVELENVTVAGGSFDVYGVSAQVVMPVALSTVDGVLAVKVTPSATAPIDAGGASLQTVATGVQSYELSAFSMDGTEGYELVWSDGESLHNVATDEIVDFEGEVPQVYTLLIMPIEEPSESKFNDSNSIFVDGTNGSDSNAGTREKPAKTLEGALGKVTTSKLNVVLLSDVDFSGQYNMISATANKTITICSESGDSIHTLTVKPYVSARVNSQFHLEYKSGVYHNLTLENVTIECSPDNNQLSWGLFFIDRSSTLTIKEGVTLQKIDARAINIRAYGKVIMEGGKITDITAGNNNSFSDNYTGTKNAGAAVYICPNGTFEMSGGEISGNYSAAGGAVYAENGGTFKVSGDAKIKDNYTNSSKTTQADVYLGYYSRALSHIIIAGALTGGEKSIGLNVHSSGMPTDSKSALVAVGGTDYTITDNDAKALFSNKPTTAGIRKYESTKDCDNKYGYDTNSIVLATDAKILNFVVDGDENDKGYDSLSEAITKAQANGTVRMTDPSAIAENQEGTLTNGVTLVDGNGNKFTGTGDSGTGVTVEAKTGKVTVTSGAATVEPAEGGSVNVGVQGKDTTTYDVTVSGKATVTAGDEGKVTTDITNTAVTIDGITYSGATSYNLENTFSSAEDNITATVPAGKTLTVDEYTEIKASGNEITVTKSKGTGEDDAKTVVDIPAGSSATIGGTIYNGPAKVELDGDSINTKPVDLYVKADAPAGGNGTVEHPYNNLPAAASAAATYGGNIYILSDLTLTSGVTFSADKTFTVQSKKADGSDLTEGDIPWTVTRGSSFKSASMVTVTKGDVTFKNVTFDGAKIVLDLKQKGGILEQTGGTVTLDTGTTLQNSYNLSGTSYSPGGVRVQGQNAVLNMEKDAIIQNNQANVDGGGLIVQRGTVNIKGGEIRYNTSKSYAAGIYATTTVAGQSAHQSGFVSIINITGGSIHDNYMSSTGGGGGAGILIALQGQVKMTGGSVTHNGAAAKSGSSAGITIWENTTGVGGVTVGGEAVIRDNYIGATRNDDGTVNYANGTESNIYLAKKSGSVAKSLTVSDDTVLATGAYIGISVQNPTGSGNEVIAMGSSDLSSSARYFHSDNSDYVVRPKDKDAEKNKLVLGKAVYLVWEGDVPNYYDTWNEVKDKLTDGNKTVYLVGKPEQNEDIDLSDGVTLVVDKTGDKYTKGTAEDSDSKITVNTDGSISVPEPSEGKTKNSVTLTPGDSTKGATVKTGENGANTHTVAGNAGGSVEITVTKDETNITASAADKSEDTKQGVIIDGVTYTGGADKTYDLDNPFGNGTASENPVTAQVPDGKSVSVPNGTEGESFTVTNPANSGGDEIDVKAPGTDNVKGTVTLGNGEAADITTPDVAKSTFIGVGEKVELDLVTDESGDHVELKSGSVTVGTGGSMRAYGNDMSVTRGTVTATKDKPNSGDVTVTVPSGSTLTVGDQSYPGATTVVFHADGTVEEVLPDYYVDETLEVNGDGSKERPYNSFTSARTAASSTVKGAKIHLLSNATTGSFTVSKNITIVSDAYDGNVEKRTLLFTSTSGSAFITFSACLTLDNVILDGDNRTVTTQNGALYFKSNGQLHMMAGSELTRISALQSNSKGGYLADNQENATNTAFIVDEGASIHDIENVNSLYLRTFDTVTIKGTVTNFRGRSSYWLSTLHTTTIDGATIINNKYGLELSQFGNNTLTGKVTIKGNDNGNDYRVRYDGTNDWRDRMTGLSPDSEIWVYVPSNTNGCQRIGTYVDSAETLKAFKRVTEGYTLVYCDGENDYYYFVTGNEGYEKITTADQEYNDFDKWNWTLLPVIVNGGHKHAANTIWVVSDEYMESPRVYVGEIDNPDTSYPKGTEQNPYKDMTELLADNSVAKKSTLEVVLSGDVTATADDIEALMKNNMGANRSVTFTSGKDDGGNPHTLTVKPSTEGNGNIDVPTGGKLTFKDMNVAADTTMTGDLFTVDSGSLTMEGVTLSGAESATNQRGVNVKSGNVTLKDTEIKGFDTSGATDDLKGKGSGVYMSGGTVTLSGNVDISKNGTVTEEKGNSNVYLAGNNTLTLDGLGSEANVGVTTDAFTGLNTRKVATGAQPGEEDKIKSDMSEHAPFYQNGEIIFGAGTGRQVYYVSASGKTRQEDSTAGNSPSNPMLPSEMDKISGEMVEFRIMNDITLPKSTTTGGSDSSNYGMRIVSSQFRIVSVYEKNGEWVQVTDPNDTDHIHTISRDSKEGTAIPDGAPMFWNVGIGGLELAYVKFDGGDGPVVRASSDGSSEENHTNKGNMLLTGVTITGDFGTSSAIDFQSDGGTLTLTDTTINGLKVGANGAVYVGASANIVVDGGTRITGNTYTKDGADTVKNVSLQSGRTVTIGSGFNGKVGVTVAGGTEGTEVAKLADDADESNPAAYAKYFSSDNDTYVVKSNGNDALVLGVGVYQVGDEFFVDFAEAKAAAAKAEDKTIHLIGSPAEDTEADLGSDITLVDDATGDSYTGGKVTVGNDGKITVTGVGKTTFTPGASGNKADVKGDHKVGAPENGSVDIDITASGATAGTGDKSDNVVIDGVTYTGAEKYDLDNPMNTANVKATVPNGESVTLPGTNGVTVENNGTLEFDITSHGASSSDYKANLTLDEGEQATVHKGTADREGTTYSGKKDGTHLELDAKGDATLTAGAVGVPKGGAVNVNGTTVENEGTGEIVVTKDQPSKDYAQVEIPAGSEATIGGQTFTGEMTVVIDPSGKPSIFAGKVELKSDANGRGDSVNVGFGDGKTVNVQNTTPKAADDATNVTVTMPSATDENKGSATVPGGGQVSIGTKTYDSTENGTVFEFDSTGNVDITAGGTTLTNGESIGFGSVELKNNRTAGETAGDIKVEVNPDGESANVTVPAGETFTVKGTDGTEHTYKNNGTGALELTVDKNGNVSVSELPSEGLVLGPNAPITVTDTDGGNENPLIAGGEGATLKPSTKDSETKASIPPLLDSGSIIFPEEGGSSKVTVKGAAEGAQEKKLDGKNVEITVVTDEQGNKTVTAETLTDDGKVTVEDGTEYTIPVGEKSTLSDKGVFSAPAKGKIGETKDGPGSNLYVLVPGESDSDKNLYTVDDETLSGTDSAVSMDSGASFDIRSKKDNKDGSKETTNLNDPIGKYEAAGDGAQVTVNHEEGTVELTDGSLNVSGNGKDGSNGAAVTVDNNVIETKNATVTKTKDESGNGTGADVTVPAGGSFTVKGKDPSGKDDKTYTVPKAEDGGSETTFHVNPDGNVELTDGSAELGEGDTVNVGDVTFGGSSDSDGKSDKTTVTVPSPAGNGKTRVEVEGGGSVTVTAKDGEGKDVQKKYENPDKSGNLTLDVDENGNVELNQGSVKLPDGGEVDVTTGDGEHHVEGDGITVTKDTQNSNTAKVGVDNSDAGATGEKKVTIDDTEYTVPQGNTAEFEIGGEKSPELTGGKIELDAKGDPAPTENESVSVNGATVEATGDGTGETGNKVTVEVGEDGNGKVTIPDGGSANVNGVEVEGPAKVEIDKDGNAKVTPGTGSDGKKKENVTVGGIEYNEKDDAETGSVTIAPDGKVKSENMTPTVKGPTNGPVYVAPGETVHFETEDGKKKTQVSGGTNGGWVKVDEDGNIILTDETGEEEYGKYYNADSSENPKDLELTVDGQNTKLTGGTVHVDGDDSITVNGHDYTAGTDGMTMTYDGTATDKVPELKDGTVNPDPNAPVKVGDNTYTPKSENIEVGMGDGNGSVKSSDGNDAEVGFKGKDAETDKEYLIPGAETVKPTTGTDTTGAKLPSPAQEKLSKDSLTSLGGDSDAKIKGGAGNGTGSKGDAYLELDESGEEHKLTLKPGASAEVTDKDGKTATFENTGDTDAHMTLDKDGNATLTDGTVKMTGGEEPNTDAGVKVNDEKSGKDVTITSKEATVTAPGTDSNGSKNGADVTVPAGGSFTVGEGGDAKTYTVPSEPEGEETTFHVNPDGTVELKDGSAELSKDDTLKFGDTTITGSGDSTDSKTTVTVPAAEGSENAKVEVEQGGSVTVGNGENAKEFSNGGTSDKNLTLEVTPEGNVELDSGAVKLPENGSLDVTAGDGESTKDYSVEGKDVTVDKDDDGKVTVTVPKNSDGTGKNSVEITDTDGNIHNYTNEGNGELEVELTPDGPAITGGTAGVPKDDEIIVPGGDTGKNTVVENTGDGDLLVEAGEDGKGGTVTVPKNGGSANFTSKDADGTEHKNSVEAPDGNDVKVEVGNDGTLTVKPEGETSPKKVTVNGKTYTQKDEDTNASLTVNPDGTVTMDPTGSFSVEVETPASGEPDKDVHLNPGESVNVGENTVTGDYPNGADLSVDSRGDVTLKDGTVKLPAHAEGAQPNNVEVEFSDGSKVHVTNPSVKGADETGKDVTVTAPDATTGKAKAEVPAGGEVSIGGATYDVPAGTGNTTFEFGKDGKAAITDGSVNLDDNEKVGFGNVELGNGGTDTDTSNDITVEVTGAGDDKKADVTVPAGETFTVKGADGKEHTYKNNGEGNLELTVDKDGNVTVKEGTSLPADGVELNGGTTLTVGDDTLTSGDKGATLKPDSTGSGAPVLDKGSVKLPEDKDTSVKVKTGTGTDGDAYTEFTGKNVEVFADASDAGKTGTNPAVKGGPGGGTVSTDSNKAYIPEDEVSVYENGNFDTPAVSELDGYKDVGKYVIVPDSDNKTSNKHIYDQSTDSGNESDLVLDNGAGFEVKEKGTGEATGNSVGHYEAASDNTQVTVDGDDGSVTLTDGSLNVSGDGKAGSKGAAVKVGENVIETKNATVTAAEDADGKPDGGADVTVPAGGNFTVKGNPDKTYKGGTGDTTYHVDAEGNVTLKEGTVELGNGESVGFGDTTITGSGDSTAPKTTVTVPAAEGSKNAKVEVEKGTDNGVKVGDNTYTNGSNTDALELEVTPKGEVELKDGTVKLPENGAVDVTAGTGDDAKDYTVETGKDGKDVTVEKNGSNATVTVPKDGNVTVTDKNGEGAGDDKTNTYTNKGTGNLEVELTPDGPVLDEGKAGLGENSELGVKTTDGSVIPVESTGNGSNGDQVTVEKNGTNTVVDIPDGGSAKVNGVEVKGPAKVTIDEATGEATVESTGTNNKSVTVGGVEYTDDPDTAGEGSVTIAPDGHVEAEGMTGKIPDDAELPIKDLHIPANGTLTYEVNGSEVELIGGENGATVDIGSNGDVTGKAGDVTVKGDVNAKVDKNAKPDTQVHQVGDVTFHVEDRNKGNVEGAQVTVVVTDNDGNEYTGTTDSAGNVTIEDIPYGVYSVVVTVEEGDETYTSTGSVTVDSANKDSTSEPFMIDAEITVNTSVNSDLEKAPSVGNLHSAAEEDIKDVDGGTKVQVDIELKANKLDRNSSSGMNSAKVGEIKDRITGEAGVRGSVTDFVDITVTKKVTTESGGDTTVSSQKMTETPLLTITFPVPAGILDKLAEKDIADELYASFIFLIRDHENVASRMTKVTKSYGERTSSECYYVYELGGNWYITIKAAKFSVYAFGVLETAEAPSNGNNTGGIGGGSGSTGGVTTGESKHGTVIIVPEEPETGDTVTVIGEPDKGYDFSGVEVLDRNGKPVDVTKNADGTYSFVMPAGGVTVTGIFTVCPSMAYTDLDLNKWYHQYTDYAIGNGLMQGIGGGKFAPDHEVTRAQMVTILWILEDKPVVNYLMPFTDMTEDKWYSEAVRWASSEQVVLGFGDDTFRPEAAITREQMALLLSKYDSWKYGTEKPEGVELSFTDAANVSGWASDAVAWGAESGYINGYGDNTFKPKATTTRVHLATIMSLYHKAHAAEEK